MTASVASTTSVSGTSSRARRATAITESPGSSCIMRTPCTLRPSTLTVATGRRMTMPRVEVTIAWSSSFTSRTATTLPFLVVVWIVMMPEPPRPCRRYSSTGVRLP